MSDARFDELVQEWVAGELRPAAAEEFAALLAADPGRPAQAVAALRYAGLVRHALTDPAADDGFTASLMLRVRPPGTNRFVAQVMGRLPVHRHRRWILVAAAAAAAVLLVVTALRGEADLAVVSGGLAAEDGPASTAGLAAGEVVTAVEPTVLRAADGSHLRLAPGTRARRPAAGDVVLHILSGQVDIEATPRPPGAAPFAVSSPHADVRVLGTRFTVSVSTATRVAVAHGEVAVRSPDREERLQAGATLWVGEPLGPRPATGWTWRAADGWHVGDAVAMDDAGPPRVRAAPSALLSASGDGSPVGPVLLDGADRWLVGPKQASWRWESVTRIRLILGGPGASAARIRFSADATVTAEDAWHALPPGAPFAGPWPGWRSVVLERADLPQEGSCQAFALVAPDAFAVAELRVETEPASGR